MSASASQILAAIEDLPVPVKRFPYWTVLYRPEAFVPERIASMSECVKLVEKARVQLRGWDFPHLGIREDRVLAAFSKRTVRSLCGSARSDRESMACQTSAADD
jgi:hypothetical protein